MLHPRPASDDDSSSSTDYSQGSYTVDDDDDEGFEFIDAGDDGPQGDARSDDSATRLERERLRELQELVVSSYPGQLAHARELAGVKKTFKLRVGVLEVGAGVREGRRGGG